MSDAAFAESEDHTEIENDEADDAAEQGAEEGEGDEEEGEEKQAKPEKNWQEIAHAKEGLAAKERSRRREAERRARDAEDRAAAAEAAKGGDDDALATLIASLRDDDDDPIGDVAGLKKAMKTFIAQRREEEDRDREANQSRTQLQKLITTMQDHEADFTDDHADYPEAAKHYKASRREELEEMGYAGQALERALANDLIGLAQRAIDSGRDPAEAVYNLAKKRGFAVVDKNVDKLRRIADSTKAGQSPSGGRPAAGRLTYESVSSLKGAAFDAGMRKLREQERRA